ncbi:MAG: mechanosensitive ion channel family protein [Candidatus Gracilibacteria bacterium]|jgi:small-conductance mechanosensitive channel|nr:mechanosensitive ion channel family protein [Candidatus Gracilibacteria bacterium]MDD5178731.1 mechanosensitive ion channel family protein [Candidatus Gracilibacteria bacterium]
MPNIDFSAIQTFFQKYSFQIGSFSSNDLLSAIGIFLGLMILFRIFRKIILVQLSKLSKRNITDLDDVSVAILEQIPSYFYTLLALYAAFQTLRIESPLALRIANGVIVTVMVIQIVVFTKKIINYSLKKVWGKTEQQAEEKQTAINGVKFVANIVLWATAVLIILSSFGFNVTTLAASLGIGGVAVAFALQNILGDLFSSFSIYFDAPFKIGDFIVVGTDMGDVKKIGLKTTRIVSLGGEELVISNTELTSTRIKNFKKMRKRRIVFTFGVVYSTTSTQLKKVNEIIRKIIEKQENADFDRCHFKLFGDFSLIFEVVYFVKSNNYNVYMDIQQAINLSIKEAFEKAKIEIAFPTQTIHLQK